LPKGNPADRYAPADLFVASLKGEYPRDVIETLFLKEVWFYVEDLISQTQVR